MDEYREAYPEIDVEAQLRKSAQWLTDNPAKRKTANGMLRFLNGWLGRVKPSKPKSERNQPRPFTPQVETEFLSKLTEAASPERVAQLAAEGLI